MSLDLQGFGAALLAGTWITVQLALCSLLLGLILGLAGALAKTSDNGLLRVVGSTYSTVVRGVPELLWILFVYLGTINFVRAVGHVFGIENLELSPFVAGTMALALCFGAYATEVFRGALNSIPKGQREAGIALGLSKSAVFVRLILPQMWRIALPGLGNLFMILMKDTALVSVIGLHEIMRKAQIAVTATKSPFTFYLAAAVIYLSLTVIAMVVLFFIERRVNRGVVRRAV